MRILIWTDVFWPEIGGMEVFCMRLVEELVRHGHQCLIFANTRESIGPEFSHYQQTPVHRFAFDEAMDARNPTAIASVFAASRRVLEEFQPEVIHLNAHRRNAFFFVRQQKLQRRPSLLTLHDNNLLEGRIGSVQGVSLMQNVDAIVAISDSIGQEALAFDPQLESKLHRISNALPVPDVSPLPLPGTGRILALGRFVRDKGFDLAIRAFAEIASHFPEAILTLAGDGEEGLELKALTRKLAAADRVRFLGWVAPEDVPHLINQHDLVVMPSRWKEPFGLVAVQTAHMARPIVAARIGALPEVVIEGVTGKLFESENVADLARKLEGLLNDPGLGEILGRQARASVLERFQFDRFVTEYENLYRKVASPG